MTQDGLRRREARVLPDIYLVGVPKAGTTSLADALVGTGQISYGRSKEPAILTAHYSFDDRRALYEKHYDGVSRVAMRLLDASPWYCYQQDILDRVIEMSGRGATLLVSLRQPVDRMVSMYRDQVRRGRESRSFETCVQEELHNLAPDQPVRTTDYVCGSLYSRVLDNVTGSGSLPSPVVVFAEGLSERRSTEAEWLGAELGLDIGDLPHSNRGDSERTAGLAVLDRFADVGRFVPSSARRRLRPAALQFSTRLQRRLPRRKIEMPSVAIADLALVNDLDDLMRDDLRQTEKTLLARCRTRPGTVREWLSGYQPAEVVLQERVDG